MSTANDDCRLDLIKAWQWIQVDKRKIACGGIPATACFGPRGPPESS